MLSGVGRAAVGPAGGIDVSVWALRVSGTGARVAVHRLLGTLLSQQLGVAPDEIELVREPCGRCAGPNGRPAVRGAPRVHFSLAYSGALALIALAPTPVGVDIEGPLSGSAWQELSPMLHPAERRELEHTEPGLRARALSRIWTRKEACLKATGAGLAHGLSEPYVGAGTLPAMPAGWIVGDVEVSPGHTAAIALCGDGPSGPRGEDRRAALHVRWA